MSACLAKVPCRWNGTAVPCPEVEALVAAGAAVPVCPEVLAGLGTPREPAELLGDKVVTRSGTDLTGAYERGARLALAVARSLRCREAILKDRSPSCGSRRVHQGRFDGTVKPGKGVFARLLEEHGIVVRASDTWSIPRHAP